jgi:hypothetical protein
MLNKLAVAGSSSGEVVSGRDPTDDSSDRNEDCVRTDSVLARDDDDDKPLGKLDGVDTSERLDDGGSGGVSSISDAVKHGMVLMRSHDENDLVGRRKDVSPDVSGASCSAMEPTDGEGARMDDS